jgi:(R,R)-butanediol dehydrogenase/meso-butanediol dehydrogenase/diacetyl reductase
MTPNRMRAAVIGGPGKLEVRELDVVPPATDEVLVRIEYCGVCGTDLHTTLDGWAAPGTIGGHEWSGRIAAIGAAVTDFAVDDLVVGGPPWCGTCEWCVKGHPSLCVSDPIRTNSTGHGGAFAEFHLTRAATVHRVPDGLDARTAALSEPLAVALHGLTNAALPDDLSDTRILVSGAGPLGLLVIAALVDRGAVNLTVSEPAQQRRLAAIAAGAATALAPEELPASPELPTQTSQAGFDLVFETSGQADAVSTGLSLLRPTGRLVLLGTGAMSVKLDAIRVLLNELVVTGAYCYDATGIQDALALLASGRLPIDALLAAKDYSLDGLLDMMKSLRSGDISRKALVRP